MRWRELLKRTFAIDLQKCDRCGGRVRIIATITERAVIDKILSHLRLAAGHSAPASPRAPLAVAYPSPTS